MSDIRKSDSERAVDRRQAWHEHGADTRCFGAGQRAHGPPAAEAEQHAVRADGGEIADALSDFSRKRRHHLDGGLCRIER